jgi:hypothetical protein
MKNLIVGAALALLLVSVTKAQSGRDLLEFCEKGQVDRSTQFSGTAAAFCVGYIEGVHHGLVMAGDSNKLFCIPRGAGHVDTARVFMKYARQTPEKMHEPAAFAVLLSFVNSYPCDQ